MHLVTQSALLEALGWSLFNSLWQMGLIWGFFILLTTVFKRESARFQHRLALLLLGGGMGWSFLSFIIEYNKPAPGAGEGSLFLLLGVRQFIRDGLPYCSLFYLLALLFLFIRYSSQYRCSRRLKFAGLSPILPELQVFVKETGRLMGIRKDVNVWLSSLVNGPVTLGFLKPVILIPLATISQLSTQQVEAILLHELAHIKRNDYLINLGVTIVEVLFFFNPFSRLLIQRIKKVREHCCDDMVMEFRYDPQAYISALLSLARTNSVRKSESLALAATGNKDRFLLQRVKRILKQENAGSRPDARALILLLLAALTAFTGLSGAGDQVARLINKNIPVAPVSIKSSPVELNGVPGKLSAVRVQTDKQPGHQVPGARTEKKQQRHSSGIVRKYKENGIPDKENGLFFVNNPIEPTGEDISTRPKNFVRTIRVEKRNFSIAESAPAAISIPGNDEGARTMPFVPHSSFSFRYIQDPGSPRRLLAYNEKSARVAMTKALKSLENVDWKKIEMDITGKGTQLNLQKLQGNLRKAIEEMDWERICGEAAAATLDDADITNTQKEFQSRVRVLLEIRAINLQLARQLQNKVLEERLKLQEEYLKKQQQSLERSFQLRKKLERSGKIITIVYI